MAEMAKNQEVTIIGYGSQGHAHALNLSESGVNVTVGLRKNGASWSKAEAAGLKVVEVAESVKNADVVMMLQGRLYKNAFIKARVMINQGIHVVNKTSSVYFTYL
jgi:ketol-acid reductoisomerase